MCTKKIILSTHITLGIFCYSIGCFYTFIIICTKYNLVFLRINFLSHAWTFVGISIWFHNSLDTLWNLGILFPMWFLLSLHFFVSFFNMIIICEIAIHLRPHNYNFFNYFFSQFKFHQSNNFTFETLVMVSQFHSSICWILFQHL